LVYFLEIFFSEATWPNEDVNRNFVGSILGMSFIKIIACGGHVCKQIGTKWAFFIEDLPRMLPTKFRFIWPSGWLILYTIVGFLAHLAKGNVSFCHHLASVVCRPLTFHILIFSSETPQPNEVKKQELPVAAMFVNGSGWNVQYL
jgi:hypothetical protein